MKTAIILHGMPSKKEEYFNPEGDSQSNKHWLPWVQKQLILNGVLAQTPELPEPYEPVYEKWLTVFDQFTVDQDTMLIGHSCGGSFITRWLSENKERRVGEVALVAPWLDPFKELTTGFFDFDLDKEAPSRSKSLSIFYSTDDDEDILESIKTLKSVWSGAEFKEFNDRGHFTFKDTKTREFSELKSFLLS